MPNFICHECGGNQIVLEKFVKMNVMLDTETLEEGALLFDEDDSFYHSYHCAKCDTIIKDERGNVIHDPEELEAYLKRVQDVQRYAFKCERCGSGKVGVRKCITHCAEVTMGEDGEPVEGPDIHNADESFNRAYCCGDCGSVLMENGRLMTTPEELKEYLSHDEHYNGPKMSDEE